MPGHKDSPTLESVARKADQTTPASMAFGVNQAETEAGVNLPLAAEAFFWVFPLFLDGMVWA